VTAVKTPAAAGRLSNAGAPKKPRARKTRPSDGGAAYVLLANAGKRFDPTRGISAYFSEICETYPNAIAVQGADRSLTYRVLADAVDNVATALTRLGVGRGDYVALFESRSVDAIIGIFGILRAGAAYVPLDQTHAPEQLRFIADDLTFKAALISERYQQTAATVFSASVPVLILQETANTDREAPAFACAHGDDPAYVLYTSGTTGTPKGVVVPQKGIAAHVLDQPLAEIQPSDVVLHASTIACDGSVFDIFAPLLNGASVAVVETPLASVDDIARTMIDQRVTAVLWYAGMHHLMIDHRLDAFETVRLDRAGGDVMSADHAARLLNAWPDIALFNVYGPTEATVGALEIRITHDMLGRALPIGKPLARYQAFAVDEALKPLPKGQKGQLAIAGPAVAIGYHNRAGLTEAKFINDPRPRKSGKVFLTGDIAQQHENGVFTFHGRADRQVKLAGRRIELDGIETCLRQDQAVSDAVVEVIETPQGRKIAAVLRPAGPMPVDHAQFIRNVMTRAAGTLAGASLPRITRLIAEMPLNRSGKVDRKALRDLLSRPEETAARVSAGSTEGKIAAIWQQVLGGPLPAGDQTFFDAGGTSVQLIDVHAKTEKALGRQFDLTLMFETPRLADLAERLAATAATSQTKTTRKAGNSQRDIAIVGLAGRFPGADCVAELWDHIRKGTNLIPHHAKSEMQDNLTQAQRDNPAYVTARPILPDVDQFDAGFFDMLPVEASRMDPQARIFLEICAEALDDAGLDPSRVNAPVGVFAGATFSTYLLANLMHDRAALEAFTAGFQIDDYATLTGNTNDNLAGRVAYKLNLKGPAMAVSTACSTSLTAIAQACQSLRDHQCDAALAGGVSITFPQKRGYFAQQGGMGSTDGVCRPFDADACGTVFGHGAGVVVLKRLSDAIAAGDQVYAVIRGAGVNNDGSDKISYTAPSVEGQAQAIRLAHQDAGIDPASVSYVECHGTATPLGDPVELSGLIKGFGDQLPDRCAIGSVKGNIGHLDAAAGVMGVIKTALMLRHGEIPPIANYRRPNPKIDFATIPFYVPEQVRKWQTDGPRRAGVSSFGVGGTNVHLLLEQAPDVEKSAPVKGIQLLPLSAKSPDALDQLRLHMAAALDAADGATLADIAFTLQEGRKDYPYRLAVAGRDKVLVCAGFATCRSVKGKSRARQKPVVFSVSGPRRAISGHGGRVVPHPA